MYKLQSEKQRRSSEAIERRFAPSIDRKIAELIVLERNNRVRKVSHANQRFFNNARINHLYLKTSEDRFLKAA